MNSIAKDIQAEKKSYDFEKIAESQDFKSLLESKRKFLIPITVFFLVFYFMLPILTSFTTILNRPAIGSITWTWVYAFAQFVMTWILCIIYVKKAGKFDHLAEQIIENEENHGEKL
ncbi:DUF485 domain-containing protein [Peribacillus huizhouensis]|uniref:Uncharacterized membrane protein (DUF485 family) n=1 Tax=Peribacillus huizhouensis TaxID=1501239 RepID=A0ABR6CNS6_9BACI|nr:DUF485 domain-containing protein [Peribacillus huizhouensis]MBA9026686.1 uncharacterized membrane protein (DUF485 family) [Peribacillus huizhouensis]